MKSLYTTCVLFSVSALLSCGFVAAYIFIYQPRIHHAVAEVRVEKGDSLASVARKLREQKLIANERLFLLWAKLRGFEKRIHLGLYRFEAPASAREILNRLATGKGIFHKITIPEGMTLKEIAALFGQMQIADPEKFLAEASAPELLASMGLTNKGIEGYLFPSTYYFIPSTPENHIVSTMTEQFRKATRPVLESYDGAHGLSPHELITLASIIEKETGLESERPLISAVFHNRLKLGMPLQSDPTVIYGLKDFQGDLTRKSLQDSSPYNTYRISGLPPGPICNPGLSSIKAALEPADVPYLYFVSKNDGSHQFSKTFQAHNQAVRTYQPVVSSPRKKTVARKR